MAALPVFDVLAGEQELRHGVIIFAEELIVGVDQLALAHGGSGLLAGHIGRPAGQVQLAHAHADGPGGDKDDLVTGVFQVAEYLA